MKREILFKAKHIHALPENEWMEGKWVEGFLSGEDYINDGTYESNNLITNKKTVTVSGKTDDVSSKPVTVTVNGATVTVGTDGTFTKDVTLAEGANTITIVAKDKAGKTTTVTRAIL